MSFLFVFDDGKIFLVYIRHEIMLGAKSLQNYFNLLVYVYGSGGIFSGTVEAVIFTVFMSSS